MGGTRSTDEIISDMLRCAEAIRSDDGPEPSIAWVRRQSVSAMAALFGKSDEEWVRLMGDASDPFWESFS